MFCAKAGAKQVIAVDNSDIIDRARENIVRNGLDRTIVCIKGLVEEIAMPVDKVDIIVSEWMGYCLLYEAMLPSVLWARDKYLSPDGLLVPSHATMWIAPISDPEYISDNVTFWRDVYGFDMKAMQAGIYDDVRVEVFAEKSLCGQPYMFRYLDLHTVRLEDLVFTEKWLCPLTAEVDSLDGFIIWFDIFFGATRSAQIEPLASTARQWTGVDDTRVAFTTGPMGTPTHWKQGILLSKGSGSSGDSPQRINLKQGHELAGAVVFSVPGDNERALTIRVRWQDCEGKERDQAWALQ